MQNFFSKEKISDINIFIISFITAVSGIINIASSLYIPLRDRLGELKDFIPMDVSTDAKFITIFLGIFLIFLSINLYRKKKVAWIIAVIIFSLSIFLHIVKGFDYEESLFFLILIIILLINRKRYTIKSDQPSIKKGILTLFISFIILFMYGFLGSSFIHNKNNLQNNFVSNSKSVIDIILNSKIKYVEDGHYSKFILSFDVLFLSLFIYSLFKILEPVVLRQSPSNNEKIRAEKIINNNIKYVISNFCLLNDKNYFFTKNETLIAYKNFRRECIVLGDPVGNYLFIENDIKEFLDFTEKNDWNVTFYQTSEDYLEIYKKFNFDNFCIGREAIVNVENFTLEGHEIKKIRSVYKKIKESGYSFVEWQSPISNEFINRLKKINKDWLEKHKSKKETTFSLGSLSDEFIKKCNILFIENKDKEIQAFLSIIDNKKNNEIGVDIMRRKIKSENGLMEFIFVELFNYAKAKNIKFVNLGLSPLYNICSESDENKYIEKFLNFIYNNINSFYNFQGLNHFKSKFNPTWEKKYIVFKNKRNLINVSIALASVHDYF